MFVYIVTLLQTMKKCLVTICPKHSISAAIEGNVIDVTYVGDLEIHRVLTYHCPKYSVWPGLLLIVVCLALTVKSLTTHDVKLNR